MSELPACEGCKERGHWRTVRLANGLFYLCPRHFEMVEQHVRDFLAAAKRESASN